MNEVKYTQQQGRNHYSVRVGPYNVSMRVNIQYFNENEAERIRTSEIPSNDEANEWINIGEVMNISAIKNNEEYLTQMLPKNHRGLLSDWEIVVVFCNTTRKMMRKVCLRNRATNEICLLTSWNQNMECKTIGAVSEGWYVCNTHMHAPASFYAAVKNAL